MNSHVLLASVVPLNIVESLAQPNVSALVSPGHVAEHLGFERGFDQYIRTGIESADQWVKANTGGGKFFLFFHTYRVHDPYTPSEPYATMYDPGYKGAIEHRKDLFQRGGNDDGINQEYWSRVDKKDPADIRHLVALYDGELTELDADLGRFLRTIQDHAPNTLIVVVSDHGELFGDARSRIFNSNQFSITSGSRF